MKKGYLLEGLEFDFKYSCPNYIKNYYENNDFLLVCHKTIKRDKIVDFFLEEVIMRYYKKEFLKLSPSVDEQKQIIHSMLKEVWFRRERELNHGMVYYFYKTKTDEEYFYMSKRRNIACLQSIDYSMFD